MCITTTALNLSIIIITNRNLVKIVGISFTVYRNMYDIL